MAQHANVINLSLGGSTPDTGEENAVASAIASGIVVVAAAGNESSTSLDYPAADPNVIAVGASGIDDSNPLSPGENVASYSNYDASHPTTWGIVAPGGNATSGSDTDDLHWIENIYSSSGQFADCSPDYNASNSTADCRILIVGTSQATPHVTGAAALLLSLGASASNMKSILCSTANGMPGVAGGCGRLNVYRAAAQVLGDPSP